MTSAVPRIFPPLHIESRFDARPHTQRFIGIDVARAMLFLGLAAAIVFTPEGSAVERTLQTALALVSGASIALATRGVSRSRGWRGMVVWGLARGVLIIALGLLLGLVSRDGVRLLIAFGITIAATGALLWCRSWVLAIIALALPGATTALTLASEDLAAQVGRYLPLSGFIAASLVGVIMVRQLMMATCQDTVRRFGANTAALGLLATVVGAVIAMSPVMPPTLRDASVIIGGVGLGALLSGAGATFFDSSIRLRVPFALRWLQAVGSIPVTTTVVAIVIGCFAAMASSSAVLEIAVGGALIVAVITATFITLSRRRGPLEAMLVWLTRLIVRSLVPFDRVLAATLGGQVDRRHVVS